MANQTTSSATREFRVYATDTLYQDVEATSAEEAYRIADEDPHFETCGGCLQLDAAVKDLETDEFIRVVAAASHCKTCGSEIVETINDSHFDDGECGACEYRRYRSQSELLSLVTEFRRECSNRILQCCEHLTEDFGDPDDLQEQVGHWRQRREECDAVIANANGSAV